jgi:type II secretory pathway component GspD/PulD (secretin)
MERQKTTNNIILSMLNSIPIKYQIRFILVPLLLIFLIQLHPSYALGERQLEDPIVIQVIHLDYADAERLASILAPLLSRDGRVVAHRPTNSLIIKDRASLVKRLVKMIKGNAYP